VWAEQEKKHQPKEPAMKTTSSSIHGLANHQPSTGLGIPRIPASRLLELVSSMRAANDNRAPIITITGR
jgi:hypothetical protein